MSIFSWSKLSLVIKLFSAVTSIITIDFAKIMTLSLYTKKLKFFSNLPIKIEFSIKTITFSLDRLKRIFDYFKKPIQNIIIFVKLILQTTKSKIQKIIKTEPIY